MTLSIVIICWNDWKVIQDCLRSIFEGTCEVDFEVIVSDNGSTDGSIGKIREQFPSAIIVENQVNLGFAKGNNAGIRAACGEYVLILNPDTIVHHESLEGWIRYAERHPEAGAFGCRVLNPDGTYQRSARPFPTLRRSLIAALGFGRLGCVSEALLSDEYVGWNGDTEREVDWQSGCCLLVRGSVLRDLGGFDERFFYHFEEVDLCRRIWDSGKKIRFTPQVSITHLGGQSVGRFPIRFALETGRNRYRYFYKHFGQTGARRCRRVVLTHLLLRQVWYRILYWLRPTNSRKGRLDMYRAAIRWNRLVDPVALVEHGAEPLLER